MSTRRIAIFVGIPIFCFGLASCENEPTSQTVRPNPEQEAEALLRKVVSATRAMKSFRARVVLHKTDHSGKPVKYEADVKFRAPEFARVEFTEAASGTYPSFPGLIVSNGSALSILDNHREQYEQYPPAGDRAGLPRLSFKLVDFLLRPNLETLRVTTRARMTYAGTRTMDGVEYRIVDITDTGTMRWSRQLYIGPDDLIRRIDGSYESLVRRSDAEDRIITTKDKTVLARLDASATFDDSDFAFVPPASAKLIIRPDATAGMIPVGKTVPSLTIPLLTGGEIALQELAAKRKAVLINFWFYG